MDCCQNKTIDNDGRTTQNIYDFDGTVINSVRTITLPSPDTDLIFTNEAGTFLFSIQQSSGNFSFAGGSVSAPYFTTTDKVIYGENDIVYSAGSNPIMIGSNMTVSNNHCVIVSHNPTISANQVTGLGNNLILTGTRGIAIGYEAAAVSDDSVNLGRSAVDTSTGNLYFKTQSVCDQGWISGGLTDAVIDNSGNISRKVSSIQMKENISDADQKTSVDLIKQLKVKNYEWKDKNKWGYGSQIGLIAEESPDPIKAHNAYVVYDKEKMKQIATRDDNGNITNLEYVKQQCRKEYDSIKEKNLIYHLISTCQYLLEKVEEQETIIASLDQN